MKQATINNIYIYSPSYKTGGPQSLHQLGYHLSRLGFDVKIVYLNGKLHPRMQSALYYDSLDICTDEYDIDQPYNLIIVPETLTYKLREFKRAVKIIWWLSVDNYKKSLIWNASKNRIKYRGLPVALTPLEVIYKILFHNDEYLHSLYLKKDFMNIFHMYNCEYVRDYLRTMGIEESSMSYLCGYVDEEYFEQHGTFDKRMMLTYNPAKVANEEFEQVFFSRLSSIIPNLVITPIKNMTRSEVFRTLRDSRLYVDFGSFPGPERIPRQAALTYNNILTSRIGSACNEVDVPIKDEFKIDLRLSNVDYAVSIARDMIISYEKYVSCFEKYREMAQNQYNNFEELAVKCINRALDNLP